MTQQPPAPQPPLPPDAPASPATTAAPAHLPPEARPAGQLPPAPPIAPAFAPPMPPPAPPRRAASARSRLVLLAAFWGMFALEGLASHTPVSHNPLVLALAGAAGGLLALQLQVLVTLALGRLGGQAPTLLMVGSGRLLGVTRLGSLSVTLRPVPVIPLQACSTLVAVPALRARLLLSGLLRVLVPAALGTALLVLTSAPLSYGGLGALVLAFVTLVAGTKQAGSTAWTIFRAPFTEARRLASLAADPAEVAVQRALLGGRVDEARTAAASVRADTVMGVRLRVGVAVAEGRYREAFTTLTTARAELERLPEASGGELLAARAVLFGMESGEFARAEGQYLLAGALAEGAARIPRLLAASEIPATQALLDGRAAEALTLAKAGLRRPTDLQTRAYALCTLAAAQAVTGDRAAARTSLDAAASLAPGLARVTTVERLITEL